MSSKLLEIKDLYVNAEEKEILESGLVNRSDNGKYIDRYSVK